MYIELQNERPTELSDRVCIGVGVGGWGVGEGGGGSQVTCWLLTVALGTSGDGVWRWVGHSASGLQALAYIVGAPGPPPPSPPPSSVSYKTSWA